MVEQLSCMISDEEWEENDVSREAGIFVLTAMDTIFWHI